MEETIFTIETDKIRTMKKDIVAAEKEGVEKSKGNLDTKKADVLNQIEKEKAAAAAIMALAQKEKALEEKEKAEEKALSQPIEELVSAMPTIKDPTKTDDKSQDVKINEKEKQVKVKVDKGDSEEEKELKPTIAETPRSVPAAPEKLPIATKEPQQEEEAMSTIPMPTPTIPEPKKEEPQEEIGLSIDDLSGMENIMLPQKEIDIGEIEGLAMPQKQMEDFGEIEIPIEKLIEPEVIKNKLPKEPTAEPKEDREGVISLSDLRAKTEEKPKQPEVIDKFSDEEFFAPKKDEDPKEKLRKITDLIFETEQTLNQIEEEKIPFEEKKKDIERAIEKARQRLELIAERKKRIEEIKKNTETKEESAASKEEKRNIEKDRWKIEEERNAVEDEKNKKEDEIKSLRLQFNEFDLAFEKIISREKELNMELELLKRDRDKIVYGGEKDEFLEKLQKVEKEANSIKDLMLDNTRQKEDAEKRLSDIIAQEKKIEEEIRVIEKRGSLDVPTEELKIIEKERKAAEEKRKDLEQKRWGVEDDIEKVEKIREELRVKYQTFSTEARDLKNKIDDINKKIDNK